MALYEDLPSVVCHSKEKAGLIRIRENRNLRVMQKLIHRNFGVTGMRTEKYVVKASDQRNLALMNLMLEEAEHLVVQKPFLDPVEMIHRRLCAPALIHG